MVKPRRKNQDGHFPPWDRVPLFSFGWPGINFIDQLSLEYTEMTCLCLPSTGIKGALHLILLLGGVMLTSYFCSHISYFVNQVLV